MGYIIRNGIKYFGDNAVELTQAEYDALPSSKLTDGVDYYITDAQAGAPLATEIAMSTSDNTSVASVLSTLTNTSTSSRDCLITFTTSSQNLRCYVQIVGKLAIINVHGYVNLSNLSGGERVFDDLPPLSGFSQLFIQTDAGRFRIWNNGTTNKTEIGIYEPTSTTTYVGFSFVYMHT